MGLFEYLEARDIDIASTNIWELGQLPFDDVFPNACECSLSNFEPGAYSHLPYKHLRFFEDNATIIWTCSFCSFWCEMIDQRITEEHLCSRCEYVRKSM